MTGPKLRFQGQGSGATLGAALGAALGAEGRLPSLTD